MNRWILVGTVGLALVLALGARSLLQGEDSFLPVPPDYALTQPASVDRGDPLYDEVPAGPVRVEPGEDLQQAVDEHSEGTSFLLLAGVHRGVQVIPRDRQVFTGEAGTVVSGAIVLDPTEFTPTGEGTWFIEGQVQESEARGPYLAGRERDAHPEDLWVDGDRRLRHVDGVGSLTDGTYYFDYDADRIYLAEDPAQFDLIENAVLPWAFAGTGVRDVVIRNMVVEKYASGYQWGALGGDDETRYTLGWTFEDLEVRYNHAGGMMLGPGSTVRNVYSHGNGQHGMAGNGSDPFGNEGPVLVEDSEISDNLRLGFEWMVEGGGTKFSLMSAGMTFQRNYVHDNNGPGVWFDVYNEDVTVLDNLVTDNQQMGIFYEISQGDSLIAGNRVTGNGLLFNRAGIELAASTDVEVRGNHVEGNGGGIRIIHDGNRYREAMELDEDIPVRRNLIIDNLVVLDDGPHGFSLFDDDDSWYAEGVFTDNRYVVQGDGAAVGWQRPGVASIEDWLAVHPGDGPRLDLRPDTSPGVDPERFLERDVGPVQP